MKRMLGILVTALFLSAASLAVAKDYQVTGPVVDVKDDLIVVKKGSDNWELARDKDTKVNGDLKKGSRVTIQYRMTATSVDVKDKPAAKDKDAKAKDEKAKK